MSSQNIRIPEGVQYSGQFNGRKDISGIRFSLLIVVSYFGKKVTDKGNTQYFWKCVCDCGAEIVIRKNDIESGKIKSCGCHKTRVTVARSTKHGMATRLAKSPEYRAYCAMMTRCYNKKVASYKYYGPRGIKVFEGWHNNFAAFYEHVGPRPSPKHSLDRIDNDKDYEPGNVRWATDEEQNNNSRNMRIIEYNGEKMTVTKWAQRIGVSFDCLRLRLNSGIPLERCFTQGRITDRIKRSSKRLTRKDDNAR